MAVPPILLRSNCIAPLGLWGQLAGGSRGPSHPTFTILGGWGVWPHECFRGQCVRAKVSSCWLTQDPLYRSFALVIKKSTQIKNICLTNKTYYCYEIFQILPKMDSWVNFNVLVLYGIFLKCKLLLPDDLMFTFSYPVGGGGVERKLKTRKGRCCILLCPSVGCSFIVLLLTSRSLSESSSSATA